MPKDDVKLVANIYCAVHKIKLKKIIKPLRGTWHQTPVLISGLKIKEETN